MSGHPLSDHDTTQADNDTNDTIDPSTRMCEQSNRTHILTSQ